MIEASDWRLWNMEPTQPPQPWVPAGRMGSVWAVCQPSFMAFQPMYFLLSSW
jgi:hypothetical protein